MADKKARLAPGFFDRDRGPRSIDVVGFHEVPVDDFPDLVEVLRPRIAVIDVVGVFPDVDGQQRRLAVGEGRFRIIGVDDLEAAVGIVYQPGPAGAEIADGGRDELFLEGVEGTESFDEGVANRAGGLEGGVTNGADLVVRAFFKPISTLRKGLPSVDLASGEEGATAWERSDVTAIGAAPVIVEAMLALVLADALLEKLGGDAVADMDASWDALVKRLAPWWVPGE